MGRAARSPDPARRRFLGAAALVGVGAAFDAPRAAAAAPLRVVATFSILADLVQAIGGDAVAVTSLVGPDGDVHVFEPSPLDARRLRQADLVVENGLHFEGWLPRLLEASEFRGPIVVAADGIAARTSRGAIDPHAWQDPALARRYVEALSRALQRALPGDASAIAERTARYAARLDELGRDARRRFDAIPRANRRAITSHDGFGYFGAAYGIDFLATEGWSTDAEPSAADVARLIGQIRATGIRAVFVENISDPRLVQQIAAEAGVHVGGVLYSDALSRPGTEADTYLKLFGHNASTIAAAM